MARVDKKIEIEDVIKTLKKLIDEGKFQHIGLSEVSARTIERAHAVHPISAVEVEYSPVCLPSFWNVYTNVLMIESYECSSGRLISKRTVCWTLASDFKFQSLLIGDSGSIQTSFASISPGD